jgi:putative CocE/NonD family hydrolase
MTESIHRLENVRIPMRDGVELSANLWLPAEAGPGARVPAILELIPYRKDDWRWASDQARMGYFAEHGFAGCRVDVRGTGSSDGVALDEYARNETLDGVELVAWLAAQPWCNGAIGMWGISYGGFTAIQVAAERPPALKAIAPMYATDDRYTDDVHYFGGCLTASDVAQYAVSQIAMNALPPRPAFSSGDWEGAWRRRLEATPPWLLTWLRQQTDGPYYRQGSLAPDYGRITCPIYNVAGWMDGYTSPAWRMHLRCAPPSRTLIGNWGHLLPDTGNPGPNVDYLDELVRFFGTWLRGDAVGLTDEPDLIAFLREFSPPEPFPATWPGRWAGFERESLAAAGNQTWWLDGATLSPSQPLAAGTRSVVHQPTWGLQGPLASGAGASPNGLWRDLRLDDATALTYTTAPLDQPLDVLGMPDIELTVISDMPSAHLVARLSALDPEGVPCLISWGALNLTHRSSHVQPEPLEPGRAYRVRLELKATGYRVTAGHRLQLTLATAHWPLIWPAPDRGSLRILTGGERPACVHVPVAPAPRELRRDLKATPPEVRWEGEYIEQTPVWTITDDVLAGTHTVTIFGGDRQALPNGTRLAASEDIRLTARPRDPAHTTLFNRVDYELEQDGRKVVVRSTGTVESDHDTLTSDLKLEVELDGEPFFSRSWTERIPRNGC